MTTIEIKKTLAKDVEELSGDALQEVLDLVEFLKIKRWRETAPPQSSRLSVADELRALDLDSLVHLEAEFTTCKEDDPYE